MQLRVLSGLHAYPELFKTTPIYLCGNEPWFTIRKGLEAYHAGKVDMQGLLRGMRLKYGNEYFHSLIAVLENSLSVPRKRWAETQVRQLKAMAKRLHSKKQEDRRAA
jgi:hypothetical protein